MNPQSRDGELFLRFLEAEEIGEIYIAPSKISAPQAAPSLTEGEPTEAESANEKSSVKEQLLKLREKALKCTLCSELASTRKGVVFGAGNIKAGLMFIGEAPGYDEDVQGLPFVGKAGQLLTKIIESIGLNRRQVFIANVLKCRPPGNRRPRPEEILNCQPYLVRQVELIRPKIICALGTFAAQTLLRTGAPISQLRGRFHDYKEGTRVLCTFHPAYLLRNPEDKRKVWEDMKMIKKELDRPEPSHDG